MSFPGIAYSSLAYSTLLPGSILGFAQSAVLLPGCSFGGAEGLVAIDVVHMNRCIDAARIGDAIYATLRAAAAEKQARHHARRRRCDASYERPAARS